MYFYNTFIEKRKQEILDKAMAKLETYAQVATTEAKRLCPVDTGQLRNSIGYTIIKAENKVSIHADQPYAFFVEFGTRLQIARPYLRPALLKARTIFNKGINTELQFPQVNARNASYGYPLRPKYGKQNKGPGPLPLPRANSAAIKQRDVTNAAIEKKLGKRQPKVVFGGKLSKSLKGYTPEYRGNDRSW